MLAQALKRDNFLKIARDVYMPNFSIWAGYKTNLPFKAGIYSNKLRICKEYAKINEASKETLCDRHGVSFFARK